MGDGGLAYCDDHAAYHIDTCQQWEAAITVVPPVSTADEVVRLRKVNADAGKLITKLKKELTDSVIDRERLYNMVQSVTERNQELLGRSGPEMP